MRSERNSGAAQPSEKEVRNRIDTCFKKKYFIGYKREGDRLVLNENKALEDAEHVRRMSALRRAVYV